MYTLYRVNADDLNAEFIESIKTLFKHQTIEIAICEAADTEHDETRYLLNNPANRQHLLNALQHVQQKQQLVTIPLDELSNADHL